MIAYNAERPPKEPSKLATTPVARRAQTLNGKDIKCSKIIP